MAPQRARHCALRMSRPASMAFVAILGRVARAPSWDEAARGFERRSGWAGHLARHFDTGKIPAMEVICVQTRGAHRESCCNVGHPWPLGWTNGYQLGVPFVNNSPGPAKRAARRLPSPP